MLSKTEEGMTFEKLEKELPNGFHDAKIRSISLEYVSRTAKLMMNLLVGVGTPEDRSASVYRPGTTSIHGLLFFWVEPPDRKYNFLPDGSPLNVDGDSVRAGQSAELDRLLPTLPQNATVYRFFVEEWNSFLYLAGASVEFSWDDEGTLGAP
jgi:hypothetical protein